MVSTQRRPHKVEGQARTPPGEEFPTEGPRKEGRNRSEAATKRY